MAQAPMFKIYDSDGAYQAACKEPEAGAALMGLYGEGATIRYGHAATAVVWTEGGEGTPAGESYDHVAEWVWRRVGLIRDGHAFRALPLTDTMEMDG